ENSQNAGDHKGHVRMRDDAERSLEVQGRAGCGVENAHENSGDDHHNDWEADDAEDVADDRGDFHLSFQRLLALLRSQLLDARILSELLLHESAPADTLSEDVGDRKAEDNEQQ